MHKTKIQEAIDSLNHHFEEYFDEAFFVIMTENNNVQAYKEVLKRNDVRFTCKKTGLNGDKYSTFKIYNKNTERAEQIEEEIKNKIQEDLIGINIL